MVSADKNEFTPGRDLVMVSTWALIGNLADPAECLQIERNMNQDHGIIQP